MRLKYFLVLFTICLVSINYAHSLIASEYLPWQRGDSALFVDSFNNAITVEIDKQNDTWQHYTNFAGLGPLWVSTNPEDEEVYVWSEKKRRIQLLVDFNKGKGAFTDIDIEPCNIGEVQIASTSEEITIPAGTFSNAIRLDFQQSCADGGVISAWFVKSAGFVKWSSSNISGVVTSEMVKGSIGKTIFPQGLLVNAIFPEHITAIDMEPPVDKNRPPHTVNVNLTVTNNTGRDLVYKFSSGQSFEIMLINQEGEIVSRWSRGMAFTEALRLLTLRNGEAWNFGGSIELSTDDGKDVSGGNYTLKIELKTFPDDDTDHKSGSETISAVSPLTIFLAL